MSQLESCTCYQPMRVGECMSVNECKTTNQQNTFPQRLMNQRVECTLLPSKHLYILCGTGRTISRSHSDTQALVLSQAHTHSLLLKHAHRHTYTHSHARTHTWRWRKYLAGICAQLWLAERTLLCLFRSELKNLLHNKNQALHLWWHLLAYMYIKWTY